MIPKIALTVVAENSQRKLRSLSRTRVNLCLWVLGIAVLPVTVQALTVDVCPAPGDTTTISGTVFAPNGIDPIAGAAVYVPNAPVAEFSVGNEKGPVPITGSPLVWARTGVDGKFTVKNVPSGVDIPLVLQAGRWRRQLKVPTVAPCTNTIVAGSLTRFPQNKNEGDVPHFAFVASGTTALECVLRDVGIQDSEFTNSSGNGRIHLFSGTMNAGATPSGGSQPESQLEDGSNPLTSLNNYDGVFIPCKASVYSVSNAYQLNMARYVDSGGRLYLEHYQYPWISSNGEYSGTGIWNPEQTVSPIQIATVSQNFPEGDNFARWLQVVGASSTLGQIRLDNARQDLDGVTSLSQTWLTIPGATSPVPVLYSFQTPVANSSKMGRVLFADMHFDQTVTTGMVFPKECSLRAKSPTDKIFEYFLFDQPMAMSQTIDVVAPTQVTYPTSQKIVATSTSHLPVDYVSKTPLVCTVTVDGTISFRKVGSCNVLVRQSGIANFLKPESLLTKIEVAPRTLTIVADSQVTIYGSPDPAWTYSATGLVAGDAMTGTLSRSPGTAVGPYPITLGSLTAGGNYTISFTGANFVIKPKELVITGTMALDKTYDGTTSATLTNAVLSGLVSPDIVTLLPGTGTFVSKDVGSGKLVTASGYALSGPDAANYRLAGQPKNLSATIGAKTLSFTADAGTKVYGSIDPVLTYTVTGLQGGDVCTGRLSRAPGDSVGSYPIGMGTLEAGSNYSITFSGANVSITPKSLGILGAKALDKVYDGAPTATVTAADLSGVVSPDAVTLVPGTATFATKDVGAAKAVTATGYALAGSAAANYSLEGQPSGLAASITARTVSVSADAKVKAYGSADPALTYRSSGLVNGDPLVGELSRASGESVGRYAIGRGTLSGGGNYELAYSGDTLRIDSALLTITANDAGAEYGARDPEFTAKFTGLVNGETDTVVKGLSIHRAAGMAPGRYAITPSGAIAANYTIQYVDATFTIRPPATSVAPMRRSIVSTALETRIVHAFARPAFGSGRGEISLAKQDCEDRSCQEVEVVLPQSGEIVVSIYDNLGTPVANWSKTLKDADLGSLSGTDDGRHLARLKWNLRTSAGMAVPEGIYVWQVNVRLKDGTKLENVYRLGVKKEDAR